NGGAAAAVRPAGQRANQDEEDQGLSGDRRETGKGGLEETISMTSQDKCAINFSTGFGTQPTSRRSRRQVALRFQCRVSIEPSLAFCAYALIGHSTPPPCMKHTTPSQTLRTGTWDARS